ncbi:cation:proton antiporter, partial [Mycobacterium tuberculosis]|nr:cation:proton antiporter [Mycobacterium tuberculosis]
IVVFVGLGNLVGATVGGNVRGRMRSKVGRALDSRAVMGDVIFYGMVAVFLVWTLWNSSAIGYEIPILAGLVCGVIPTISMARIISRGRR